MNSSGWTRAIMAANYDEEKIRKKEGLLRFVSNVYNK